MPPQKVPVLLNGPGNVGRKFIELLEEKAPVVEALTGCTPVLVAVKSRRGIFYQPSGLKGPFTFSPGHEVSLPRLEDNGRPFASLNLWGYDAPLFPPEAYVEILDKVAREEIGIVVEATPTDLKTGEPGLSHIRAALSRGFSVVSLAKGPLVVAFGELLTLARKHGATIRYSGAVAAALPTIDTALYAMAGARIYEIEGVLNGTTNFILNQMALGKSYRESLRTAQDLGVVEKDPSLDVKGFDSAAKLLIMCNTVWCNPIRRTWCEAGGDSGDGAHRDGGDCLGSRDGGDYRYFSLSDVSIEGITALDPDEVRSLAQKGTPMRLLARAERRAEGPDSDVRLMVAPVPVPQGHPFAYLEGTKKAITFRSKEMGEVTVLGGASDVLGAAASCLKDLIHLLEKRRTK